LWAISSKEKISELQDITIHIDHLKSILKGKIQCLEELKINDATEVSI